MIIINIWQIFIFIMLNALHEIFIRINGAKNTPFSFNVIYVIIFFSQKVIKHNSAKDFYEKIKLIF
jgi:hypothetical protein